MEKVQPLTIPHLREYASDEDKKCPNTRADGRKYANVLGPEDLVIAEIVRGPLGKKDKSLTGLLRAGPRAHTFFDPSITCAAIVTCGGLCPGLNDIIFHLFSTLRNVYGVSKVYGVRGGWNGFHEDTGGAGIILLKPKDVEGIQYLGGTVLGTSRGGFDADIIHDKLIKLGVNILFVVGGDGTHRGAGKLSEMFRDQREPVSVVGIPKTIDNDVGMIDRSFGFQTAVDEAVRVIRSARTEARSNVPNGIGVVKLMGRHAGYIAAHATLASGDVDLCLIPELHFDLDASLRHILAVLRKKGSAVVVIAEGAGADVLLKRASASQTDASGAQPELPPIGPWFVDRLKAFVKERVPGGAVKYIDPSYIIRSVPANAADSLYCMMLSQNAVHASMAGYTGCSVGLCNNRIVLLPITKVVEASPRTVNPRGRTIERLISITHQPRASE